MRAGRWPAGRPAGLLTLFLDGWRRVGRSPGVLTGVWAMGLISVPGFYYLTMIHGLGELAAGTASVAAGSSRLVSAAALNLTLAMWTLLWGGIVDRYAEPHGNTNDFFAACWRFGGRMLRLGLIAGIAYALLLQYVQPALYRLIARGTLPADPSTRAVTLMDLLPIILAALPLYAVHVLADLTRVRLVLEDRRSVAFAAAAAWRLLTARPLAVLGVYLLSGVSFAAWFGIMSLLARAGVQGGVSWVGGAAGLLLWVGRAWAEMLIPATLVALYQSEMGRGRLEHDPAMASSGLSGFSALTAKE